VSVGDRSDFDIDGVGVLVQVRVPSGLLVRIAVTVGFSGCVTERDLETFGVTVGGACTERLKDRLRRSSTRSNDRLFSPATTDTTLILLSLVNCMAVNAFSDGRTAFDLPLPRAHAALLPVAKRFVCGPPLTTDTLKVDATSE